MTTVTQDIRVAVDALKDSSQVAAKFIDPAQTADVQGSAGILKPLAAFEKEADEIVIKLGSDVDVLTAAADVEISRIGTFTKEIFTPANIYTEIKIYFVDSDIAYTPIAFPFTASALIQTDIDSGALTVMQGLTRNDLGRKGSAIPKARDTMLVLADLAAIISEDLEVGQQVKAQALPAEYLVVPTGTGSASTGRYHDMGNGNQLKLVIEGQVDTWAELELTEPQFDGQIIKLVGHTVAGLGGGTVVAKYASTRTKNGGTVAKSPLGLTWERELSGLPDLYMFGCLGDGSDDSVGFQNAATAGDFHIPKCDVHWLVGGITVPNGRIITGDSSYVYTAFSVSNVAGLGAVVYDTSKGTFISWGASCEISQCTFHGVDRSRPFQEGSGGGLKLYKVAVFRCEKGFGRTAHYTMGNCRLLLCHFSGNTTGIAGLVDSHVAFNEVNANEGSGIRASAGCNDTVYMDNKVEWNNTKGYEFYGNQSSIQIIGGIVDRNGEAGISATGYAGVLVLGVKFRRNGRLSELNAEQNGHVALRGGSQKYFRLVNCDTAAGTGDSGEGYNSPAYSIVASDSASVLGLVSGCDLTGANTQVFKVRNGGSLSINSFIGNDVEGIAYGSSVNLVSESGNTGIPEAQAIPDYGSMIYRGGTGNITAATDLILTGLTSVNTYSRYAYDIHLVTRNPGDDTYAIVQEAKLVVVRGGGNTRVEIIMLHETHTMLGVTATTSEADGSEITITVTPDRLLQVVMMVTVAY